MLSEAQKVALRLHGAFLTDPAGLGTETRAQMLAHFTPPRSSSSRSSSSGGRRTGRRSRSATTPRMTPAGSPRSTTTRTARTSSTRRGARARYASPDGPVEVGQEGCTWLIRGLRRGASVAGDGVRDVGLLEPVDLGRAELELLGGERVLDVRHLGGAEDRRSDARAVQEPGESDLGVRGPRARRRPRSAGRSRRGPGRRVPGSAKLSFSARVVRRSPLALRFPASRPRASGLQGITATPWSRHCGIISRSSSR